MQQQKIILFHPGNIGDIVLVTPVVEVLQKIGSEIFFVGKPSSVELLSEDHRIAGMFTVRPSWGSVDHKRDGLVSLFLLVLKLRDLCADISLNFGSHPIPNLLLCASRIRHRYSLNEGRFNLLAGNLVTADESAARRHKSEQFFSLIRKVYCDEKVMPQPRLIISKETRRRAAKLLGEHSTDEAKPVIAIHPGSNVAYKNLPVEEFIILIRRMRETLQAVIVLLGQGPSDVKAVRQIHSALHGDCIDLSGRLKLPLLAGVLELCDLFIGNDSGPSHIAAAACGRVVTIFRCTDSAVWRPYGAPERCRVFDLRDRGVSAGDPWPPKNVDAIREELFQICMSVLEKRH